MELGDFEHAGIKISGLSLAGVRTSLTLPQYSIAFDVAQGLPHALSMHHYFISHGHMDHASGIPYIISQKAMGSHKTPSFYMPESMVNPMSEIMKQWSKIEGFEYAFKFYSAKSGDEFEISSSIVVKPFKTLHRVPSLGYSVFRKVRKLRTEFVDHSSSEIAKLKLEGIEPTKEMMESLVSFTGDTQIEFLDLSPEVRNSKILVMETTYLDDRKSIQSARDWGHTHLQEVLVRLPEIKSERIVLIHSSARYSWEEAKKILEKSLRPEDRERVVLFPGR
jgi:ribonuclease Z